MSNDLTIIYYTANNNTPYFMANTQRILLEAAGDLPIISVSFKPTIIGNNCMNICVGEQERSMFWLWKQILIGVREAKTRYVAMAEDDTLYPREYFTTYRPPTGTLGYVDNKWSLYTWVRPPIVSIRGKKTMCGLVADRLALLKTLEERYDKYPELDDEWRNHWRKYWGEPGRRNMEKDLGISYVRTRMWTCKNPLVVFSTPEAFGFLSHGTKKAHHKKQAKEVPYWGSAESLLKLYQGN